MTNTESEQSPQDEISPADVLAVHLLFKRIAERGHRIRMQRQAAEREKQDGEPPKETQNEH